VPLGFIYGRVAHARRHWYARRPWLRRRLRRPVISVGNITVGGTGKTPLVAHLASVLLAMGERPAILSRGYARPHPVDGVVLVSDGRAIRADLRRAGDEPLMLARAVPEAIVAVAADRHLAGRLAEARAGCTVHLLDDGFQHCKLERDVDLLVVDPADLTGPRLLPAGRLREPLGAARLADAVIVLAESDDDAAEVGRRLGVEPAFRAVRRIDAPRLIEPDGRVVSPAAGTRVLAFAGVARPARFFVELKDAGWMVAGELAFPDHYRYSARDVRRILDAARDARAVMLLTTEKDLMRLLAFRPLPMPLGWVPLQMTVEPAASFREWLAGRLADARERSRAVPGADPEPRRGSSEP
jgi:tetraacyldisaccharide 4'-kinase